MMGRINTNNTNRMHDEDKYTHGRSRIIGSGTSFTSDALECFIMAAIALVCGIPPLIATLGLLPLLVPGLYLGVGTDVGITFAFLTVIEILGAILLVFAFRWSIPATMEDTSGGCRGDYPGEQMQLDLHDRGIRDLLEEMTGDADGVLLMDGFDDCLVGVVERIGEPAIACYDRAKVIERNIRDGMDREEAEEFFEYNQIGAWMGEGTPCYLTTLVQTESCMEENEE